MQIVTDSGTDIYISQEEAKELNIHIVPLYVTLDGKTYREGIDIQHEDFYTLLESTNGLPTTSTPSAGDFAAMYRKLAETDPNILSVHISSGLSGTYNAALAGAELVPEAKVTHVDAKTLSAAAGWQVVAAARAFKKGASLSASLNIVQKISAASESVYSLKELKYLIHGGRISHMKGVIANLLNIKPVIGVEKVKGTYVQITQARTFQRALQSLSDHITKFHAEGSAIRVQVLHAFNPEGAAELRSLIEGRFQCTWLPMGPMSLVLGAHTGRSMVGVAFAAANAAAWDG